MAAFGHFGCPKFTLIAFLAISDRSAILNFRNRLIRFFVWTNDIVKTEQNMVYIVDRPFQRSFVTLHDCLFLVAMTTMCIFLYSVNIGNYNMAYMLYTLPEKFRHIA